MGEGETLLSMCEDGGGTFLAMSTVPGTTLVGLIVLPRGALFEVQGTPVNLETLTDAVTGAPMSETEGNCNGCGHSFSECTCDPAEGEDEDDNEDDDEDDDEDETCPHCSGTRYNCTCENECGECGNIEAECTCHEDEDEDDPVEAPIPADDVDDGSEKCKQCDSKDTCPIVKKPAQAVEEVPKQDSCEVCGKPRSQCLCT
jgi:hypothetical protein